jgi:predicted DNA-binding antitoxin AbrB/MazE fold protein
MTKTIQAVYADGVFKPSEPITIAEGTSVELTVRAEVPEAPVAAEVTRHALLEIASMPLQGPDDGFSGADHDKVLYGGVNDAGHVDAR